MDAVTDPLARAIALVPGGRQRIADACKVKYQAVQKWEKAKRLPRSEFSGETRYASIIERETGGAVTKEELLRWSRQGWRRRAVA